MDPAASKVPQKPAPQVSTTKGVTPGTEPKSDVGTGQQVNTGVTDPSKTPIAKPLTANDVSPAKPKTYAQVVTGTSPTTDAEAVTGTGLHGTGIKTADRENLATYDNLLKSGDQEVIAQFLNPAKMQPDTKREFDDIKSKVSSSNDQAKAEFTNEFPNLVAFLEGNTFK